MINEKELRIGSIVKFNESTNDREEGEVGKFKLSDFYSISEAGMDFDNIDPIPLTEEILLKCGFKKSKEGYWDNGVIEVGYTTSDEYFQYEYLTGVGTSMTEMVNVKYLHQLQNLYFCLTGKELEVNL